MVDQLELNRRTDNDYEVINQFYKAKALHPNQIFDYPYASKLNPRLYRIVVENVDHSVMGEGCNLSSLS